ncbi:MAG: hypothetical protein ACTSUG_01585 [Candidatus Helarchaeota archaeon]
MIKSNDKHFISRINLKSIKNPRQNDKLIYFTLFLFPLIIGMVFKLLFFYSRYLNFDTPFMGEINSQIAFGPQNVEFYDDFRYYTLNFVRYFLSGHLPYTHYFYVDNTPNPFMSYTPYLIYPPLYLYIISMFGTSVNWIVGLQFLLFDIISGIFIFKIVEKTWNKIIIATFACLIYELNPLNFYYCDYCWLNPPIFIFFLLGSIYFLINDRYNLSILFLGLSIMCKQFAGIFLPILLIRMSRKMQDNGYSKLKQLKKFIKTLFVFILPISILSMPYILPIYPDFPDYLYHIFTIGNIEFDLNLPAYQTPVDFVVPFIAMHFGTNFLLSFKYLLEYYIFLISSIVIICCIYSFFVKRNESYNENTLIITLILLISMTLFYPRGFYKYYTVLFVPLMSIFIMKNLKNKKWDNWRRNATEVITDLISVGIYYIFSISILFVQRYFTPFILLSMILYYTYYGYINFNSLLKKFFRIYSRKINSLYEKYQNKFNY